MILILEEVDLPDYIYKSGEYDESEISEHDFPVSKKVIEKCRLITFRYWDKADIVFKDLKNSQGPKAVHVNNHPDI